MNSPLTTNASIQEALAKPFGPEDVKSYSAGRKGAMSYIDARSVMNRLDTVVGADSWEDAYTILDLDTKAVECRLTVRFDSQIVTKTDVGYPNDAEDADDASKEPLKAAYSDALKRAAVKFGIGRHLYSRGQQNAPAPAQRPPAASTPPASIFNEGKLRELLRDAGLTAADLVSITGAGANGGPKPMVWLEQNKERTMLDLVNLAKEAKAAQPALAGSR